MNAITASADDKIQCMIDGEMVHSIQLHLTKKYPDGEWNIERYTSEFPDAPLLSAFAEDIVRRKRVESNNSNNTVEKDQMRASFVVSREPMHEVFELGKAPAAFAKSTGKPIPIETFSNHAPELLPYVPSVDKQYVFDIDMLKQIGAAFGLNMPLLVWGLHGTGKTSAIMQVAARTRRPVIRVQHTANTEESHILGQWVVRNGATEFQLGPLPMAMLNGSLYLADEYDFALPHITSVYQPIMEGEPLVIKEAMHLGKIIPHKDFRFAATANTNGTGDETGLYQGTNLGNAANYSRFGVTIEVNYMPPNIEAKVMQARGVPPTDSKKIVKFANKIREEFKGGKISMTISPREMINSGSLAIAFGNRTDGLDWFTGIDMAYANRLPKVDAKVVRELAQRIFGGKEDEESQ